MSITAEAIFENGTLKFAQPLPLKEHDRVRVTIQAISNWVQDTHGIMGWTGDAETLRRIAEDPDLSVMESP